MALERIIIAKIILTWMCVQQKLFFRKIASDRPINLKKWINKNERKRIIHTTMNNKLFLFWCKQVVSIIFYYSTFIPHEWETEREEKRREKSCEFYFSQLSFQCQVQLWNEMIVFIDACCWWSCASLRRFYFSLINVHDLIKYFQIRNFTLELIIL